MSVTERDHGDYYILATEWKRLGITDLDDIGNNNYYILEKMDMLFLRISQ